MSACINNAANDMNDGKDRRWWRKWRQRHTIKCHTKFQAQKFYDCVATWVWYLNYNAHCTFITSTPHLHLDCVFILISGMKWIHHQNCVGLFFQRFHLITILEDKITKIRQWIDMEFWCSKDYWTCLYLYSSYWDRQMFTNINGFCWPLQFQMQVAKEKKISNSWIGRNWSVCNTKKKWNQGSFMLFVRKMKLKSHNRIEQPASRKKRQPQNWLICVQFFFAPSAPFNTYSFFYHLKEFSANLPNKRYSNYFFCKKNWYKKFEQRISVSHFQWIFIDSFNWYWFHNAQIENGKKIKINQC